MFYGTLTALVEEARDADDAWTRFLAQQYPNLGPAVGRLVPPTREEATVRPLERADASWVQEVADLRFVQALGRAES